MELYEIEYFLAIAESLNVSKAAERLYISQSALSQFLLRLETSLGTKLFRRSGKKLEMTEAGTVYYYAAQEIKECKEKALIDIRKIVEQNTQELNIGITGSRSLTFASSLIPLMKEKYPSFSINFSQNDVTDHCQNIKKHSVDLAFGAINYVEDIDTELFKNDEIGCFVSKDCFPGGQTIREAPISIEEMEGVPFVMLAKGSTLRRICDDYFNACKFIPNIYIECSQFSSLFDVINHHALATLHSVAYKDRMPNAIYYPLNDPPVYQLGIMYDSSHLKNQCLKDFIDLAVKMKGTY